jgi:hypothetical protein
LEEHFANPAGQEQHITSPGIRNWAMVHQSDVEQTCPLEGKQHLWDHIKTNCSLISVRLVIEL